MLNAYETIKVIFKQTDVQQGKDMSKAGIQSNRGDGYQTLVAFDWALRVLSDPTYAWIEVDSTTWPVDDVVIGKTDDTVICCQCKKNQPTHTAWTVSTLADELRKATQLLASDSTATVRFYSRTAFGELAALKEYGVNYADARSYRENLGVANRATDKALEDFLPKSDPSFSTFDFLGRTHFENTPGLELMQELLQERLRQLSSNSAKAYQALWTHLDHLGMRANVSGSQSSAIQHRLTKADLKTLIEQEGATLASPINVSELRAVLKSTSIIGRNWRRDIGGERIQSPLVSEIMAAIDGENRAILVMGNPGSGKTCVMLSLQEALENRSQTTTDIQSLFIQSREFADLSNAQERQALGLNERWVECVARMAEAAHTVVVIDSLDVLSIAREHSVLDYFLAQIDRLLLIPNVTVITACRDFDRRYDKRIAQRQWDREFKCAPLSWDTEIAPLLSSLGIDISSLDHTTRELISNPRELALYVELAQQRGSFNVVTSQALAQHYLNIFVQSNASLGDVAMQALEETAAEMLKSRSLAVPVQRFPASQGIQRALLSQQILQFTQDEKLTFGHQTLLDVLVISRAIRQGITLDAFIRDLPSVPFVRPSIRSFIAQLATEDRRKLRAQLRTVLLGNHAFHIRRLVAECLVGQPPHDEDWPLIRDLKAQHPDVFQVIYFQGIRVEWHYFWLKFLVPNLIDARDKSGLERHVQRVAQWKNEDAQGVIDFWLATLSRDWVDREHLCGQLTFALYDFDRSHAARMAPLLEILLQMPRQEHSVLGHALARCVVAGGMTDVELWRYIVGEISAEDVRAYHFGNKLHCQPHEFGSSDDKFLSQRMQHSIALLDLAVATVEQWQHIKDNYRASFLRETSYSDAHSQTDMRHVDGERVLWDAIEFGIVFHAKTNSEWWQRNRERLCFSVDAALSYFAILGCTEAPMTNLDVIGHMLCKRDLLESALSYELGTLILGTFIHLDARVQDAIQKQVLEIDLEHANDPKRRIWMLQAQAQLILAIPCHLRSIPSQAVVAEYENFKWPLLRQPSIDMRVGMVGTPFFYEIFLGTSDRGVLNLLKHYNGYAQDLGDEFLTGGEDQVGGQLREAASRDPSRFIALLDTHWDDISTKFRNDILDGARTYLAYKNGNLQSNNWTSLNEPDAVTLAQKILGELEKHPEHWHHSREAASALEACAHVIQDTPTASRLMALTNDFLTLTEESSVSGDSVNLLTKGINMAKGKVADALIILVTQLKKHGSPWPEQLSSALKTMSGDAHPAVRAVVLRRLPYLLHLDPDFGRELFQQAMHENCSGLWEMAEPCLYYTYHKQFDFVAPWLDRLRHEGVDKELAIWGRISALSALSNQVEISDLLATLKAINSENAWHGAASVWTHPANLQQHRTQCLTGLQAGLEAESPFAGSVARKVRNVFRAKSSLVAIPIEVLQRCFTLLEDAANATRTDVYGIDAWLNATSLQDPTYALEATEIYIHFVRKTKSYIYDHENNLTQLLTRLFTQAEEQEEADGGSMLQRVVGIQDDLMALGVNGVEDWLKAVERL